MLIIKKTGLKKIMPKHKINNNEIEIEVHKSTKKTKKKYPFILVRGLGSQLISWGNKFIKSITDNGYDVYIFDNRDSGLSTKFDDFGDGDINKSLKQINLIGYTIHKAYDLYDNVEDVKGIVDYFGFEKIHLVGCSMGGMIAQLFGQKYNDLLASLCIMYSTTKEKRLPYMSEKSQEYLSTYPKNNNKEEILEFNAEANLYFSSSKLGTNYENSYKSVKESYERNYCPDGMLRQYIAVIATGININLNDNITAPTLILHGDSDPIFSVEHGKSIHKSIPKSKLIIIKNWAHDIPEKIARNLGKHITDNAKEKKKEN